MKKAPRDTSGRFFVDFEMTGLASLVLSLRELDLINFVETASQCHPFCKGHKGQNPADFVT